MSTEETFEEFKNSFFYGSRSDMGFKFIEHLSNEEASTFIEQLFQTITDALDSGNPELIRQIVIEGQVKGYAAQSHFSYEDGPFTPFAKEVTDATFTLLTSSGHFMQGDDPKPFGVENLTQKDAEKRIFDSLKEPPILSEIPFSAEQKDLIVRHGGYDTRAAMTDANVSFPFERLKQLLENGEIGGLTNSAYSFVGSCSQKRLLSQTLPDWVEKIQATGCDGVILVPV